MLVEIKLVIVQKEKSHQWFKYIFLLINRFI